MAPYNADFVFTTSSSLSISDKLGPLTAAYTPFFNWMKDIFYRTS